MTQVRYNPDWATHPLLHPVQFRHVAHPEFHKITAHDQGTGEKVGYLEWARKPDGEHAAGEILDISVNESHQRKGIATAMYDAARQTGLRPRPQHSPDRTEDGDAWVSSLGERAPANRLGSDLIHGHSAGWGQ